MSETPREVFAALLASFGAAESEGEPWACSASEHQQKAAEWLARFDAAAAGVTARWVVSLPSERPIGAPLPTLSTDANLASLMVGGIDVGRLVTACRRLIGPDRIDFDVDGDDVVDEMCAALGVSEEERWGPRS